MQMLEPRKVDVKDIIGWFKEAQSLLIRRVLLFFFSVFFFFLILFFSIRAFSDLAEHTPPLILLPLFLVFTSFILYLLVTDLVMSAMASDNSQKFGINERIMTLLSNQAALLQMAMMGFLVGATLWTISLSIKIEQDVISACISVVEKLILTKDMPVFFMLKLVSVLLYFMLLGMFILRNVFCIPLVVFHELSYKEAKVLSHKAIMLNFPAMSAALLLWAMLLLGAMVIANVFSILLLPLLAAFLFVAYRHIFLDQKSNSPARALSENTASAA